MSQTNMVVVEGTINNVFDSKSRKVKVVQLKSDNSFEGKDGHVERVSYVKFTAFQSLQNYDQLKAGAVVKMTGSVGTNSYEKDGVKHYDLQIVANKVEIQTPGDDVPTDIPETQEEINKAFDDIPF